MTDQERMQQLAREYENENRDYHDSDGVDVSATFLAGYQAALAQLAQVTAERDDLKESVAALSDEAVKKFLYAGSEYLKLSDEADQLRSQLLASAAENVRMKSALERIAVHVCCLCGGIPHSNLCVHIRTEIEALSTPPTALVGAIEGILKEVRWVVDKGDAYSGECISEGFEPLLAAFDDAMKGGSK